MPILPDGTITEAEQDITVNTHTYRNSSGENLIERDFEAGETIDVSLSTSPPPIPVVTVTIREAGRYRIAWNGKRLMVEATALHISRPRP